MNVADSERMEGQMADLGCVPNPTLCVCGQSEPADQIHSYVVLCLVQGILVSGV